MMGQMNWEKSAIYKAYQFTRLRGYHPDQVINLPHVTKYWSISTPLHGWKPQVGQLLIVQYIYNALQEECHGELIKNGMQCALPTYWIKAMLSTTAEAATGPPLRQSLAYRCV